MGDRRMPKENLGRSKKELHSHRYTGVRKDLERIQGIRCVSNLDRCPLLQLNQSKSIRINEILHYKFEIFE
jgi:hypothetical protein